MRRLGFGSNKHGTLACEGSCCFDCDPPVDDRAWMLTDLGASDVAKSGIQRRAVSTLSKLQNYDVVRLNHALASFVADLRVYSIEHPGLHCRYEFKHPLCQKIRVVYRPASVVMPFVCNIEGARGFVRR